MCGIPARALVRALVPVGLVQFHPFSAGPGLGPRVPGRAKHRCLFHRSSCKAFVLISGKRVKQVLREVVRGLRAAALSAETGIMKNAADAYGIFLVNFGGFSSD